ncbi:cystathionine beta-lyase [Altererythrobacter sp.]|uniref:cystathionine beta-lyase n=1 Tax=Altererythrobacter sp. TaxID=1872480 RepID=UPI003D0887E1
MSGGEKEHKPATRMVEAGRKREWTSMPGKPGGVVNPPVWRASTHLYDNSTDHAEGRPNEDGHFYYGRRGGPTQWALADALTEMEPGAQGTQLFPSGVAAIACTLQALLRPGDELLVTDNAYEPTRNLAMGMLKRQGVDIRPFDPLDLDGFPSLFGDTTRVVMMECPGSLTMEVCDVPALARIAREKGAVSVLDNTWASPLGFAGLAHGCDVTVMSLTKHVGGHSDLMMGSATATNPAFGRIRRQSQFLGQVVSPDDASLALRGLRSMALRLERETASALAIAEWLSARSEVSAVLCPMLPGAPGHAMWQRDFTGGCGLFSFVLADADNSARARFIDALDLFGIGYSWGGFESLITPFDPAPIHQLRAWPPGIDTGSGLGVRLSIGLEDPADLIADLEHAFAAMGAA